MLTVGATFPAFKLTAVSSSKSPSEFHEMTEQSYPDKWKVYFFWPKDFTFVCPTEIVAFANLDGEFRDRDTVVIGGSTDSDFVHLAWRQSREDLGKITQPWLSDIKRELSAALGILHAEAGVALRATFVVDPQNVIRHVSVNDLSVGRNPLEILRILDALQTDELCPCNWKPGDEVIKVA